MKDRELFVWFQVRPATKSGGKIGVVHAQAIELTRGKRGWRSQEWQATLEHPSLAAAWRAVRRMRESETLLREFLRNHWCYQDMSPPNGRRTG